MKFYAAAVLPALLWVGGRRSPRPLVAFGVTAALAYLPYLGVGRGVLGYLPGYLAEEGFESGQRFYLLGRAETLLGDLSLGPVASSTWYPALAAAAVGLVVARMVGRPPASARETIDRALLLLLLMLLGSPTYPWYLLLMLARVPVASARVAMPAAVVGAGGGFLYLQWWLPSHPAWPLDVTWGLGLAALVIAGLVERRAQGAAVTARGLPRATGSPG